MSNDIKIIDHSEQINAIRKKYGEKFHHLKEPYQEAAQVWGFLNHNAHGVLEHYQTEKVVDYKGNKAEIHLAESSTGNWLIGVSAMTSISGHCYSPSVFSSYGFSSYEDARLAGIIELQRFFDREARSNNSCGGASHKIQCEEVVKILQSEKQPQLDMFGLLGGSHAR
mgnify:CR=1 FL=1